MPFTQSDIDALEAVIKTGGKVVRFQDRTVEYQTTGEMLKALALMTGSITTSPPIRRQTRIYTSSGW